MSPAVPGRGAHVLGTADPPPGHGQAPPGPESSRWRVFPLLNFTLHGFLFIPVNRLDVLLCGGLKGWKGVGMKAPGTLWPEPVLQKVSVVLFITCVAQNLARNSNS